MSANTSFFTTFAMLHFTHILANNAYLKVNETPVEYYTDMLAKNTYLNTGEYLTSTINDKSINTST